MMYDALCTTYSVGQWREYLAQHSTVKPLDLGPIDVEHCALVLVDLQRKLADRHFDPSLSIRSKILSTRASETFEAERAQWMDEVALPNTVRLLHAFRDRSRTVLHFATGPNLPQAQDLPLSYRLVLQPTIEQAGHAVYWESPGYEFPERLAPIDGELVIRKRTRSGFIHTSADNVLRALGITDLVVVGGATEVGSPGTELEFAL